MIRFGKVLYVILWFDIIWYGNATMLKNVDYNIWQNAGVIVWQKADATIRHNAGNIMILCSIV